MAVITLRRNKGFALTFDELDDNFAALSGGLLSLGLTISDTAPANPTDGELWLDTGITNRTFTWYANISAWVDISPGNKTTVSGTEPATKNTGDAWFDTSSGGIGSLVIWNGNAWLEVIGAGGGGGGGASSVTRTVQTGSIRHDSSITFADVQVGDQLIITSIGTGTLDLRSTINSTPSGSSYTDDTIIDVTIAGSYLFFIPDFLSTQSNQVIISQTRST